MKYLTNDFMMEAINEIRSLTKWLLASFGAVAALLVSGLQLSNVASAAGASFALSIVAVSMAILGVLIALWSGSNVILPRQISLALLVLSEKDGKSRNGLKEAVDRLKEIKLIPDDDYLSRMKEDIDGKYEEIVNRYNTYYEYTQNANDGIEELKKLKLNHDKARADYETANRVQNEIIDLAAYERTWVLFRRAKRWWIASVLLVVCAALLFASAASKVNEDEPGRILEDILNQLDRINSQLGAGALLAQQTLTAVHHATEVLAKASALGAAVTQLNRLEARVEDSVSGSQQTLAAVRSTLMKLESIEDLLEGLLTLLRDRGALTVRALSQIKSEINGLKLALSELKIDMTKTSNQLAREQRWK